MTYMTVFTIHLLNVVVVFFKKLYVYTYKDS